MMIMNDDSIELNHILCLSYAFVHINVDTFMCKTAAKIVYEVQKVFSLQTPDPPPTISGSATAPTLFEVEQEKDDWE